MWPLNWSTLVDMLCVTGQGAASVTEDREPVARGADVPRQELADNRRPALGSEKPFRHATAVAPSTRRARRCLPSRYCKGAAPPPVGYTLPYPCAIVGAGDPRAAAKIEALTHAGVVATHYLAQPALRGDDFGGKPKLGVLAATGRCGRPTAKHDQIDLLSGLNAHQWHCRDAAG